MAERMTWRHGARSQLQALVAAGVERRAERGEVFEAMSVLNVGRQGPAEAGRGRLSAVRPCGALPATKRAARDSEPRAQGRRCCERR